MILDLEAHLHYRLPQQTELILQLEAAQTGEQNVCDATIAFSDVENFARLPAESGIGERLLMSASREFSCTYTSRIEIHRTEIDLRSKSATPIHALPGNTLRYLMPSRYCPSDEFQAFVAAEFHEFSGGQRISVIADWINERFSYVSGSSGPQTTALDTFVQRKGICRDFAHVMIALSRASSIPARFASVYAPRVDPPDFHAVAEVYLEGDWHLLDTTGMSKPHEMAIIGVGLDAAEVAFMTSYGEAEFVGQAVTVNTA